MPKTWTEVLLHLAALYVSLLSQAINKKEQIQNSDAI